jgi:hypothetical protein
MTHAQDAAADRWGRHGGRESSSGGQLKAARDRKSAEVGYTIGNTQYAKGGTLTVLAQLRTEHPNWSQDQLGEALAERGILNSNGKRLAQVQVSRLLRQM